MKLFLSCAWTSTREDLKANRNLGGVGGGGEGNSEKFYIFKEMLKGSNIYYSFIFKS